MPVDGEFETNDEFRPQSKENDPLTTPDDTIGTDNDNAANQDDVTGPRVVKLYLSRFFMAWGDRLWSFGLGLFLFEIQKTNLMLLAVYGLAQCLTSILFLTLIGHWIDKSNRLHAAQLLLVIQNSCVAICCALLGGYFAFAPVYFVGENYWLRTLFITFVIFLALVASLASSGTQIVVERDWIVVIADKDEDRLALLNSRFRTIDLFCLTVTPAIAGFFFSYVTYIVAAGVIGAWNVISVVAEYALLLAIYKENPALANKNLDKPSTNPSDTSNNWLVFQLKNCASGWRYYSTNSVRNAGIGLACLYMTVLGFDSITWGYSLIQCVPEWVLGILVAVSGVFGIVGSITFPLVRKCAGLTRTAFVGISAQTACLSLCVVSIWLEGSVFDPFKNGDGSVIGEKANHNKTFGNNDVVDSTKLISNNDTIGDDNDANFCDSSHNPTSISVFLAGIITARFGLWMTDLAVSQLFQEHVTVDQRGIIGGVQTGLNSFMDLIKFGLVLLLPGPETFGILILLSFGFVLLAFCFIVSYVYKMKEFCCQAEVNTETEPRVTDLDETLIQDKIHVSI